MAIVVEDVLRHAKEFEHRVAELYAKVSHEATREGVRLLADYMSRHRVRIAEALGKLSQRQIRHVYAVPLRFDPKAACGKGLTQEPPGPDATAAQLLELAMALDECLMRLYREVLAQPVDEEVKEVFESLLCAEQRDEIELKKIEAMDYF